MGGGGKGGQKATLYHYYASMLLGICWGRVNHLRAVYFGEKLLIGTKVGGNRIMNVWEPEFFGGNKKEGGAQGGIYFFDGRSDQRLPSGLAQKLYPNHVYDANRIPGYRDIAMLGITENVGSHDGFSLVGPSHLHFKEGTNLETARANNIRGGWAGTTPWGVGFWVSVNNPYLKQWWAEVARASNGWYPSKAVIYRDMADHNAFVAGASIDDIDGKFDSNGVHVLYEVLTNDKWGMGAAPWAMDEDAWRAAADLAFAERLGVSFIWREQMTIEAFAQMMVDHLRIAVFPHPETGLISIRMLRSDYEYEDLPQVNENNSRLTETSIRDNTEVVNEIIVKYTNPENNNEEVIYAHDLASIATVGDTISETHNYKLFRRPDLAEEAANRDVFLKTAPVRSAAIVLGSNWKRVAPGEVLAVHFPDEGITNLPMRIGEVEFNIQTKEQRVALIEDIFAEGGKEVTGGQWAQRQEMSQYNIGTVASMNAPYFMARQYGFTPEGEHEYHVILADVSDSSIYNIELSRPITLPNGGSELRTVGEVSPVRRGVLPLAMIGSATALAMSVPLTPGYPIVENSYVIIGTAPNEEICLVTSTGSTNMTLRRGILDTVPRYWPAGTPITVLSAGAYYMHREEFSEGASNTFTLKPVSFSSSGNPTVTHTATLGERAQKPIRPANVRINGVSGSNWTTPDSRVTITNPTNVDLRFNRRNRLLEDAVILAWSEAGVNPEANQLTAAIAKDADGVEIVSNTSATASLVLNLGAYTGDGTIEVYAVRDGMESYQRYIIYFTV